MIASACPWIIRVGHLTFSISFKFSNLSLTNRLGSVPSIVLTAAFSEVYGERRMSEEMLGYSTASAQLGPDPIDLPIKIMSLALYRNYFVRNCMIRCEFVRIVSAFADSVLYTP